jgi:signal transduction histidine kinase/DNA-binding response OmpR family regulator
MAITNSTAESGVDVRRESHLRSGEPVWFEPTTNFIYLVIAVMMIAIASYDFVTPLGLASWVFYCIPIVIAFLLWQPAVPPAVAVLATVLSLMGYLMSPPNSDAVFSIQNRSFAAATYWVLGVAGFFFIRAKLTLKRQEWLQAAEVGLAQRIGGELSLPELGNHVLGFLASYLGARAATIFVDDGESFQRSASFAVPESAPVPERVKPGDGLLGQAIKDGRTFVLQNVPEGYLYFGSSFGQSAPARLLIAPVKVDDRVNAVMEFGFTEEVRPISTKLFEQVSQSIGVAVRSARYRTRLHELLEETRRQAEELQRQSEELRATNEELEQQTRALEASQKRLEQQQTELEQTNALLEEQTTSLEGQRADLEKSKLTLQEQARELEQVSRYKTEFLANMSHELRTPLNSALIMARLLADNRGNNLTPEQVKYAETIEAAGNDLLTLINDILDLSKIEAGRVEVNPEPVSVTQLFEKLSRTFQPIAAQRRLEFRTTVADGIPEQVETDPQRVEQVLKNFLSNAMKFTEKGTVSLDAKRLDDGRLAFTVEDTGIGIPTEQHRIIFEAFRQADGTTNRKYGGTGLGLSISRELARLLGGHIELASEIGKGSRFTLVLPSKYDASAVVPRSLLQTPGIPHSPQLRTPSVNGSPTVSAKPRERAIEDDRDCLTGDSRVILIVEDDSKFARVLRDLAHEQGFQCLIAETADEGVDIARQYMPHGIILDVGLPDHSGLSVLDRLKHNVRTRHIPVHIASMHDYTHTAMAWGAVGYMLKPIKREELVQALQGFEERLNKKMRRVLVVEDDEGQLESVRALLGSANIDTIGTRSAADSLQKLQEMTFDCMVLDLTLPDVSGFELLEQLSQDEDRAFPPVIVYTGRDLTADEELQLRRYSKSIIIKGARSPERLLDEVTLFLHQVVSDLPADQQKILAKAVNRDGLLEGKRIVVVEDDVRNVFALTSIFEPQGAIVEIARNGREALDLLNRLSAASTPADLVLMDVMMPEMDGLTATREIRQRPDWSNLPVIVLTAKAMANDQDECIRAGANDYMAKPVDVEKLLSLVRVWMPR